MQNMKKTICILAMAGVLAGCTKFLDVNPKGEVFDADMFESAEGYEDALYGVYSEIANEEFLYKGYLLWIPEALSRNEGISDYMLKPMAEGSWYYTNMSTKEKVWAAAYEAINHVNNIIAHAEKDPEDRFRHSRLYKGEALALRALLHFELLRLYGAPFWADASFKQATIPYVRDYAFTVTPFSSWDETFDLILEDLFAAETLLAEDENLIPTERTNVGTSFAEARITHLNLYAVQALIARVYWTRNDLDNAARYALKVIDSHKFGFRPLSSFVQPDNGTLDLNETIFGLYSRDFQTANATKYQLRSTSSSGFTLNPDWSVLYNDGSATQGSDLRVNAWFDAGSGTLTKMVNTAWYAQGSGTYSGDSIIGVSILRIPELYYIVAEYYLQSNTVRAAEYFNAVTETRNLDPVANLNRTLLFRERRKEFYGEGLTWHEMKKLAMDITTDSGTVLDGGNPNTWTMPISEEEAEGRKNLED